MSLIIKFIFPTHTCFTSGESLIADLEQVIFVPSCPVSILHKSIAGRYRPVRIADGPITARCRFIKNASWVKT